MLSNELGLMAFWADVEPAYLDRFREWHNCEHMPERVAIPGFRTGHRYRSIGPGRMFLMSYETATLDVLKSDDYLERLNSPTPWTLESLQHFRNPLRNIYRKLGENLPAPAQAAPYITCARLDVADSNSRSADELFAALAPRFSTAAARRARLFELDADTSKPVTKERLIYGPQPDSQRYLLLVDEPVRPDLHALAGAGGGAGQAEVLNLELSSYWLDFHLRA